MSRVQKPGGRWPARVLQFTAAQKVNKRREHVKKIAYGSRGEPEELFLEVRVEGNAPHPSLEGQSERREPL